MTRLKTGLMSYAKAVGMLLLIALGWVVIGYTGLAEHIGDYDWVKERIAQYGWYGPVMFILAFGLSTVIGVPRLLISAIAGFSFPFMAAVIIALVSTLFGCVISFYYARHMGRDIIRDIMSLRIRNIEKLLVEHSFLAGIAIRALPISNNTIVNLLAGVTGVRPLHYFAGSAIGYLPLTIVFVLAGSGVQQDAMGRLLLSIALYVFLVIPLGYVVQQRIRNQSNGNGRPQNGEADAVDGTPS